MSKSTIAFFLWNKDAVKMKGLLFHFDRGEFILAGFAAVFSEQRKKSRTKLAGKLIKELVNFHAGYSLVVYHAKLFPVNKAQNFWKATFVYLKSSLHKNAT
jgi:hypothetical protein